MPLFADHLLANGVIVLPCNVGDTIYRHSDMFDTKPIWSWEIALIEMYVDEVVFIDDSDNRFGIDDIGKTVFLTREEAEAKLESIRE